MGRKNCLVDKPLLTLDYYFSSHMSFSRVLRFFLQFYPWFGFYNPNMGALTFSDIDPALLEKWMTIPDMGFIIA